MSKNDETVENPVFIIGARSGLRDDLTIVELPEVVSTGGAVLAPNKPIAAESRPVCPAEPGLGGGKKG